MERIDDTTPIKVWLDPGVTSTLQHIIADSWHFALQTQPDTATLIIFDRDLPEYISNTSVYKTWPEKCVVVSETDLPTYFLPACYASNRKSYLGKNRSVTIPFLISQYYSSNPFITATGNTKKNRYLYAFRGGSTSWVRKRLFKLKIDKDDVLIQNSSNYHHWNGEASYVDEKKQQQQDYAKLLQESTFFLCPRGAGVSSIRLFEVMQAAKVPVILADSWIPVSDIPWKECAVFVPENDLDKIDTVVRSYEHKANEMGTAARKAWEMYCAPSVAGQSLATALKQLQKIIQPHHEKKIRRIYPLFQSVSTIKTGGKTFVKRAVLKFFSFTGLKFSYELNRPIDKQLENKN